MGQIGSNVPQATIGPRVNTQLDGVMSTIMAIVTGQL